MSRKTVSKGRAILAEGEPNDALYVVVTGSFRLTKYLEDGRRQVTGFLFKSDFVGVRPTEENPYTVEALEDSLVCVFPHKYLEEVAKTSPGVKDRLIARAQNEYHKAQDHIVLLGRKNAEERVLSFLKMVHEATVSPALSNRQSAGDSDARNGTIEKADSDDLYRVHLSMPRQDIADYLGLRLETLSRTLAALKKKGVIGSLSRTEIGLRESV
ncbi:MAG: cyclic nucleotide-binding domain-containing protein [Pseudomonadota bacterium]